MPASQWVLIHGTAGGVGHLAVQIAQARGAHVIGCASAAKHDLVASLGADELIDYRVTDTIGGDIARRSIGVLHPGGLLVTIVGRRDVELAARTRRPWTWPRRTRRIRQRHRQDRADGLTRPRSAVRRS